MQIDALKVTDYLKTNEESNVGKMPTTVDRGEDKKASDELRPLKVENSFYDKKGKNQSDVNDLKKNVTEAEEMGMATLAQVNNLSKNWSQEATEKVSQDGYDVMDMDTHTLVTVVDEIKMNMAKAGADVSKMGGLDSDVIKELSASELQAVQMASGIESSLSDASIKYLVTNELEPTIANMYSATYANPASEEGAVAQVMTDDEAIDLLEKLGDKLDELIAEADGADIDLATKMLKEDIPLTKDNLEYMAKLEEFEKPSEEEILLAIEDIEAEGKAPDQAYLMSGYSLMDQAREKVDYVNSIEFEELFDVSSRRQIEEVRLEMTVEATFTMMKNGVDVNTSDLSKLIDSLKAQETSLLDMLMKTDRKDSNVAVELFKETMNSMADIEASPAWMLGRFSDISQSTLSEVHQVSISVSAQYSKMEMTYEAVGTEVRRDLGDNINKAFQNVDDILSDLGMDASEGNEKAVRILAYNEMEITAESVTTMKESAELVNRTFKNMTPAVVAELIKRGENPLDLKMGELNEKTQEIKAETGNTSDSEGFAKFLWKAEHAGNLTEEERDSFVGVYRLLHQVEKGDGAAIGALISQGLEVTLRNLMTAVRSAKHTGKEYEVSDKVGELDEVVLPDLSITEQIEKVFMTNRCRDAKEAMTPEKMKALGEDTFMEMNPDEFASAMEVEKDEASEKAYNANLAEQLKSAIEASRSVYEIIEEYNLPSSANIISAIEAMLRDNNSAIKELYGKAAEIEDKDIEDLINEVTEKFLDACDTPEEMAEAEEALGVLAENVMKTMVNEEKVRTVDLDGMKLIIQQAKAYQSMARDNETYHIPIMVADEAGNMNLKIVRGTNENGLVKLALYMESTGTINSTFRYEKDAVNANITFDNSSVRDAFASEAQMIAERMREETGFSFTFSFAREVGISVNDIYKIENGSFEVTEDRSNEVQTEALYGIAKSFISLMGEMFS